MYAAQLGGLISQVSELNEEIAEYEKLKAGKNSCMKLTYEDLPNALIKARITRGMTQEQLAEKLGVVPQQVQRDEATRYSGASHTKLLEVQRILSLDIQLEITFLD